MSEIMWWFRVWIVLLNIQFLFSSVWLQMIRFCSFYAWTESYWGYSSHFFICPSGDRCWVCLHFLAAVNIAAVNMGWWMFLQHKDCIVFGYINHMIILLLGYVRYPHTVLHSGCISLHFSNSMNLRVSFSSLPHQHMLSFVFLIRAWVLWYLTMVLIFISLVALSSFFMCMLVKRCFYKCILWGGRKDSMVHRTWIK